MLDTCSGCRYSIHVTIGEICPTTILFPSTPDGGNAFTLHSATLAENTLDRLRLESHLQGANERGEMRLHYQPKVDLRTGGVVGVEALARWISPDLGPVGPSLFVPVLEDIGLVGELGAWALREACQQVQAWREQGMELSCAVNISARQWDTQDIQTLVTDCLADTGVPSRLLCLELTESGMISQPEETTHVLAALRQQGVKVSLDDFGTGVSSLGRLSRFGVDEIKLDQVFVRGLPADVDSAAIARAVLGLGRSMAIDVVAEGIEHEQQHNWFLEQGGTIGQGFFYSRALPAEQVPDFVRSR